MPQATSPVLANARQAFPMAATLAGGPFAGLPVLANGSSNGAPHIALLGNSSGRVGLWPGTQEWAAAAAPARPSAHPPGTRGAAGSHAAWPVNGERVSVSASAAASAARAAAAGVRRVEDARPAAGQPGTVVGPGGAAAPPGAARRAAAAPQAGAAAQPGAVQQPGGASDACAAAPNRTGEQPGIAGSNVAAGQPHRAAVQPGAAEQPAAATEPGDAPVRMGRVVVDAAAAPLLSTASNAEQSGAPAAHGAAAQPDASLQGGIVAGPGGAAAGAPQPADAAAGAAPAAPALAAAAEPVAPPARAQAPDGSVVSEASPASAMAGAPSTSVPADVRVELEGAEQGCAAAPPAASSGRGPGSGWSAAGGRRHSMDGDGWAGGARAGERGTAATESACRGEALAGGSRWETLRATAWLHAQARRAA